jgi:hypothetical protein
VQDTLEEKLHAFKYESGNVELQWNNSKKCVSEHIMIHKKQLDNVEYFNYLGSMITNDARYTGEIKSGIATAKAAFNKKKTLFTRKLNLNLSKKLVKYCIWRIASYGGETWTVQKVDQKYLESFEMWCWRRMEISWTNSVRNEEVLHRVKGERNVLLTIRKRKANWIGHTFRRNCVLKLVIAGKIEGRIGVTGR